MKISYILARAPVWAGLVSIAGLGAGCGPMSAVDEGSQGSYEAQLRMDAVARDRDPAWKPVCQEVSVIRVGEQSRAGNLHNFCLATNGNILACWGSSQFRSGEAEAQIKVFTSEGELVTSWPLPSTPEAICVDRDGNTFVGGAGRLLKLDAAGKILITADSPVAGKTVELDKAAMEALTQRKMHSTELERYKQGLEQRKQSITGLAVTDEDVFVACPSVSDFTFTVYRLDRQLEHPELVVKGLRGCCGQMDIQAKDGKLWIPHNARHRVECYDRTGKKLLGFGKTDRRAADGFGGCCEPKNLRLGNDGKIYAAESGPPVVIKRFSAAGEFETVAALPKFKSDCVRVTVEVSPDCKRLYILSTGEDAIHVLAANN